MLEHQQAHNYGRQQHCNTELHYQDDNVQSFYDQNGSYTVPVHNQQQDGDEYYDESYLLLLPVDKEKLTDAIGAITTPMTAAIISMAEATMKVASMLSTSTTTTITITSKGRLLPVRTHLAARATHHTASVEQTRTKDRKPSAISP